MRVFLVLDETRFHQPAFVRRFLETTTHEVVGCALVVRVPEKHNIESYFRRNWRRLSLREMATLGLGKHYRALRDVLTPRSGDYSVRSVLRRFGVPTFSVRDDINTPEILGRIRAAAPDVIVSSNSLVFGDELLRVPRVCCLNRHSALLPAYRGLLPVFQAFRSGERRVGVSVHRMEKRIDEGPVLACASVPIKPTDTLDDLYDRCFEASAGVVNEALEKVARGDFSSCAEDVQPSYYSFPTEDHWRDFRARSGRII